MVKLEVCANGVNSALVAQNAGAYRVELCDNLLEGGTTPSYGQIVLARKLLDIKLYPIIRPRGGDFVYSDLEFEIMKMDVQSCKSLGCDGVVFGILQADGKVDVERCKLLLEVAHPLPATFHRAFDDSANFFEALEDLIALGFERVLTSGGAATAMEGVDVLNELVKAASNRIEVMPGAGVTKDNVASLVKMTNATSVHGSFSTDIPYRFTDIDKVKAVVTTLSNL
jgi:copper homeostasis protein